MLTDEGDIGQALGLLRSADDLRRLKSQPERLRLFGTLLEADQPREALRRAIRWLRGARQEDFADLLIDQMVLANRYELAMDFVRDVGTPGDPISLSVAELMLLRDQDDAARAYLRGWLDKARIANPAQASRFIRASLDASDPETALKGAQRFGMARVPQNELERLSDSLATANRISEANIVRSFLRSDTPLPRQLATPPMRRRADQPPSTEASRDLEAWRLTLWTRLMGVPEGNVATATDALPPSAVRTTPNVKSRSASAVRVLRITKAKRTKGIAAGGTATAATATAQPGVQSPPPPNFQPGSVFSNQ